MLTLLATLSDWILNILGVVLLIVAVIIFVQDAINRVKMALCFIRDHILMLGTLLILTTLVVLSNYN